MEDHCSHTLSHQVNGALTSREGDGHLLEAGFPMSDWFGVCCLPRCHCPIGPAACGPYRQVVVGTGFRLSGMTPGESANSVASCRDLRLYGALWPRQAQDSGVRGFIVATPYLVLLMGAQTLRVPGDLLLNAVFSRDRLTGASRSWCCLRVIVHPPVADC